MLRSLAVITLLPAASCKLKEVRDFFQARPVDLNTDIKIETTPRIGDALSGLVEIDGARASEKTPFVAKHVTPGPHQVRVSAKGYVGQEMEIDAKEGQVTPLSLALQPLPTAKPALAHENKPTKGGRQGKEAAEAVAPTASADYSPHVVILTATPAAAVTVDGTAVGTSTGLHLHLDRATGEIGIAGGASLSYFNRGNRVSVRPNVDGKSTLTVDGAVSANGKGKVLELDQRPRRLEITDVGGASEVILLKLAE